jgi:hypothetical protein
MCTLRDANTQMANTPVAMPEMRKFALVTAAFVAIGLTNNHSPIIPITNDCQQWRTAAT